MNLNDVHHGICKNKSRRRVGRGPGSGRGKTASRGSKGQGSRSGSSTSPIFEGGQMPLVRRIPEARFQQQVGRHGRRRQFGRPRAELCGRRRGQPRVDPQ